MARWKDVSRISASYDLPSTVLAAVEEVSIVIIKLLIQLILYVRHADLLRALGHLG